MVSEKEFRVIGPPGTGKTTYLCDQVERAVEAYRGDSFDESSDMKSEVLVASLTRAAAAEVNRRKVPVDDEQVGTLHAHAFRALERPTMVSGKWIKEWNSTCRPSHAISATGSGGIAERYAIQRAMMRNRDVWPDEVKWFAAAYEPWKRANNVMDFSDLIHECIKQRVPAPGNPRAIFIDESQDHDAAELQLVRQWAETADRLICVGDADQAIYEWRGASPSSFMRKLPPENIRVLSQSYRVPAAVHERAQEMIRRIGPGREDVSYRPTPEAGEVVVAPYCVAEVDTLCAAITDRVARNQSAMLLASCRHLIDPVEKRLRELGVPMHNPYAGPGAQSRGQGIRSDVLGACGDRVAAFLRINERFMGEEASRWTWGDLWAWLEPCRAKGLLRHGKRSYVEGMASRCEYDMPSLDEVSALFEPEQFDVNTIDLAWWVDRLGDDTLTLRYAIKCAEATGCVRPEPRVICSTIHGVKGGESDVVFLSPDLSFAAQNGADVGESSDQLYRLFYVGMTRARQSLVLLSPVSTNLCVRW